MKFSDLLYFYAILSCHSDIPFTDKKRKKSKEDFEKIIGGLWSGNIAQAKTQVQMFSTEESTIQALSQFTKIVEQKNRIVQKGSPEDLERIKNIILEMQKNPQSIIDAIREDANEEELESGCIQYLNDQLCIIYPHIDEYNVAFAKLQLPVVHAVAHVYQKSEELNNIVAPQICYLDIDKVRNSAATSKDSGFLDASNRLQQNAYITALNQETARLLDNIEDSRKQGCCKCM